MTTKITLFEYSPNGDGVFYSVLVNDVPQFTDFEDKQAAKAAAFDTACLAAMEGPVRVEYVSIR